MSDDKPKRLPYRWILSLSAALILAVSMGSMINGMSAYVVPMEAEYGWDRAEVSLINVAGIVGLALGGLLMGTLADRFGTRPVVVSGGLVLGSTYLAAALADQLWQFYGLMFLGGFFGAAGIFAPVLSYLGRLFSVGLGLAIGVATAGQALGQGGMPFVSAILIDKFGTSFTFFLTGVVMLLVLVPLGLLFKPVEKNSAGAPLTPGESDYPPFNKIVPIICLAIFLCCSCMSIPLMHLVPYIQGLGHTADQAGSILFVMLMAGILGRIAFGKLADVIGAIPAYMTATTWMAIMVYGFILIEDISSFYLFAPSYGFGYAGVMTGVLATTATYTAPSRRAFAMGLINMFGFLGHANGGFLGGYLYDSTGSYSTAYATAAFLGLLNVAVVGLLYLKVVKPFILAQVPRHT